MTLLKFTINGETVETDVREDEYLAEVLRYRLGLTGTKIGCNEAECGICTVLVNGLPVDSCLYPALKVEGADILTIEGLAKTWHAPNGSTAGSAPSSITNYQSPVTSSPHLHPLQEAFAKGGAPQCGFCIPG